MEYFYHGSGPLASSQRVIPGQEPGPPSPDQEMPQESRIMRDIVIAIAFLAMLLSPCVVASFQKGRGDDEV